MAKRKISKKKTKLTRTPKTKKSSAVLSLYLLCKDREEALNIAQNLVEEDLVACFNLFENVTSIYRWKGELEKSSEIALIGKCLSEKKQKIVHRILELHSYEVPAVVFLPVVGGAPAYLDWLAQPH